MIKYAATKLDKQFMILPCIGLAWDDEEFDRKWYMICFGWMNFEVSMSWSKNV